MYRGVSQHLSIIRVKLALFILQAYSTPSSIKLFVEKINTAIAAIIKELMLLWILALKIIFIIDNLIFSFVK